MGKIIMHGKKQSKDVCDKRRREFLKTSMYAAYATPVIMSLLVEKASAGISQSQGCEQNPCSNPNCPHDDCL